MKIKLTAQGGLSGKLELETIDTDNQDFDFPEDLLNLMKSEAMGAFEESSAQSGLEAIDVSEAATESEVFCLTVADQEGEIRKFNLSQNVLQVNPNIDRLVKFIWAYAKPVVAEK